MADNTDHADMIADCEKRESQLTDWERSFIDSIGKQIATRPLSEKQAQRLDEIWERVT